MYFPINYILNADTYMTTDIEYKYLQLDIIQLLNKMYHLP